MAGKATSVYITVATKGNPFDIKERKQFFNAADVRKWKKTAVEQYPETAYRYTTETY